MIGIERLSKMILYLKPYRYRCISPGAIIEFEGVDIDYDDYYLDEASLCEQYPNAEFNYLQKLWFEIVGISEEQEEIHIGHITGYTVDISSLLLDLCFDGLDSFIEFDGHSHLLMELWHYISEAEFGELEENCYFMNNITLRKEYRFPEVEKTAIELLRKALYEIYRYEINTIIYSIGRTELDDDTVLGKEESPYSEIEWKLHEKNLLSMGFKKILNGDGILTYLFKEYDPETSFLFSEI